MNNRIEQISPSEIERRSMEIIEEIIKEKGVCLDEAQAPIIKRAIHTSADFDYLENLVFSPDVIAIAQEAIRAGATIVTDTHMALAGINKKSLARFGAEAICFMADDDVAHTAEQNGTTRATAAVDKAAALKKPLIFVVGNAPTALVRICELVQAGELTPILVVGVPVGFVNVVEAKELLLQNNLPKIVARGRKGGSNLAAAIINALVYQMK